MNSIKYIHTEAMSKMIEMRKDLYNESYSTAFSKMYDDRGSLIGYIGYGFFIRRVNYPRHIMREIESHAYRFHVYYSGDCFAFRDNISKTLNRKFKLFFNIDSLEINLGPGLEVFKKFEDAKKFCILRYLENNLENTNHKDSEIKITVSDYNYYNGLS